MVGFDGPDDRQPHSEPFQISSHVVNVKTTLLVSFPVSLLTFRAAVVYAVAVSAVDSGVACGASWGVTDDHLGALDIDGCLVNVDKHLRVWFCRIELKRRYEEHIFS